MLIGRRVGQGVRLELVFADGAAAAPDHECGRLLALDRVGHRHDRGLLHRRVAFEQFFDFTRIDVFAARDEHVVAAADKEVEAVLVTSKHVAGDVVAVIGEGRLQRRVAYRTLVIAQHQRRRAHLQHPLRGARPVGIAQAQGHRRVGATD